MRDTSAEPREAEPKLAPATTRIPREKITPPPPLGNEAPPLLNSAEAQARAARMDGALLPGSTFGVYSVGECIGEGGMARIYRAEHAGLRRKVALKVLTNGFSKDSEGRERFVREARIAAAIKHPNVVNIFDVGVHEDIPYLVMELLEGTDLESMLATKGALEEAAILDIMVPVVAGLIAVHDAGIVHRDLKPGNIFLAKGRHEEFEPKLLDFGISKASGTEQLKLTTRGLLIGTPFYMSPEGFRGEEMTALSDQYSLGVVMYECATGCGPFKTSTLRELARAITTGNYLPPNEHNPNISKRLTRIILRAMSLNPAHRYKDLREMGRELLQLSGQRTRITWGLSFGEAAAEGPSSRSSALSARSDRSPTRARRVARNGSMALLPLALFAFLLFFGPRDSSSETGDLEAAPVETGPLGATSPPAAPVAQDSVRWVQAAAAEPAPTPAIDRGPEVLPLPSAIVPVPRVKPQANLPRPRLRPATSDAPAWALPSSTVPTAPTGEGKPAQGEPPPGTNGAPIFD